MSNLKPHPNKNKENPLKQHPQTIIVVARHFMR